MIETNLKTKFKLTRIIGDVIVPSNCELDLRLGFTKESTPQNYFKSLQILKIWQETVLNTSLVLFAGTELNTSFLQGLSNNIILCPEEPLDTHLVVLLHSKLNAICDNNIGVTETRLIADINDGFYNTFKGDVNEWLPSQKIWMGDVAFFDLPWWHRSDGSTIDMPFLEGDDINNKPDILIDLEEMITSFYDDPNNSAKEAEIIKPKFNPKIIKND